jgi:hypothetical protein
MKYFNDLLAERKSIRESREIAANDKAFNDKATDILQKFGVKSPTQLNEEQYKVYLQKLSDIKNGIKPVAVAKETPKTLETAAPKVMSLPDNTKKIIQEMINSVPMDMAAEKITTIFKNGCPNDFIGVVAEGDTLKLNFKGVSYTFEKGISEAAATITSPEKFRAAAYEVLSNAHGKKYDKDVAKKMVDDLLEEHGDNYLAAWGALTSGFGK